MKQATKRFLSMIVGLAILVASLVVYFEFIQPAYQASQSVKSRQLGQQMFLREEQSTIKKVQDLISAYRAQEGVQRTVSLALPAEEDFAGALAQLYGLSKASGLSMRSLTVSTAGVQNIDTSDVATEGARFSLQRPVSSVSFRLGLSGPYSGLKLFLSRLETNIRIFDLEKLAIQPTSATGNQDFFNYELTVLAYYQAQ